MPAAPRPNNKATKIAWNILGIPDNIKFRRTKEQKRINKRLNFEETQRVR